MSHSSLKCVKNAKALSHFPVRWETHHFPPLLSLLTTTCKDHALYSNTDSQSPCRLAACHRCCRCPFQALGEPSPAHILTPQFVTVTVSTLTVGFRSITLIILPRLLCSGLPNQELAIGSSLENPVIKHICILK